MNEQLLFSYSFIYKMCFIFILEKTQPYQVIISLMSTLLHYALLTMVQA